MENHSDTQVLGSGSAPFGTGLARQCATASRYESVGSPSLPNYLGATSGSTHGVADDAGPGAHPLTVDNLFRQVRQTGRTARSYLEAMPANCYLSSAGRYAVKHNPAAYYVGEGDRAACLADDVPMGTTGEGAFVNDLTQDALPAFSLVTPDQCNDTHDCSVATGDGWLQTWVPRILDSPAYRSGTLLLFIVWDEPTPMPFIAIAPAIRPGSSVVGVVNHYSLLRTTEEALGITQLLGAAASAPSMRPLLGL